MVVVGAVPGDGWGRLVTPGLNLQGPSWAKKPKQSPYGLSPQEASELKRINKEKHKARRSRLKQRRDNPSSDH